ncbi:MAG: AAA family ATPase [Bacteroidales bacterium]|nr:AAA family ATPase [Bacteroidales bacterium]
MPISSFFEQKIVQKLPFKPNRGQQDAIEALSAFILDESGRERIFVLRGYAGTGKTSLVGALVKAMDEMQMRTFLMAPTGRAAKVFAQKAEKTAFTIHKSIYRQQRFSVEMEGFQLLDNRQRDVLFICDEASMISTLNEGSPFGTGNLLDDLIEYVYSAEGCRLLLVGDDAQLPPVGQVRSPALDVNQLRGYGLEVVAMQLTEVARQQLDSGILANATVLRQQLNDGLVEALPRVRYKCFNDVRRIDGYEFLECLETSYSRQGLDDTIIITRSNKRANQFNQGVRNQILGREEELSAGDRLLVVRNNYFWGKEFDQLPFIANGDVVDVKRVRNVREMYGFRFADAEILLPDYDIETEVTLMLDTLAVEGPNLPQSRQQELFAAIAQDYPEIRNQRDLYKMMKANPYFNALQVKYGYCVTCHKSQGGQWSDVYLDVGYINPEHLGVDFYRWIYTAFTRATQTLYLVNPSEDMLASD